MQSKWNNTGPIYYCSCKIFFLTRHSFLQKTPPINTRTKSLRSTKLILSIIIIVRLSLQTIAAEMKWKKYTDHKRRLSALSIFCHQFAFSREKYTLSSTIVRRDIPIIYSKTLIRQRLYQRHAPSLTHIYTAWHISTYLTNLFCWVTSWNSSYNKFAKVLLSLPEIVFSGVAFSGLVFV